MADLTVRKHVLKFVCFSHILDVNECDDSPCNTSATCENNVGNFGCTCNLGFVGNGFNCTGMQYSNILNRSKIDRQNFV